MKFLTAALAKQVDVDLMRRGGFTLQQLMELAGLSVASVVNHLYPKNRILVVAGPGNNGGDGLVAARWLKHFQHPHVGVFYPKPSKSEFFGQLVTQCKDVNVAFDEEIELEKYDVVLDAIFGFSFTGTIRSPFDTIISEINLSELPIVSVDIPSGWHVEEGPCAQGLRQPDVLISLTAPKLCAKYISSDTKHFIGGRFVPDWMKDEYNLEIPSYSGSQQFVPVDAKL
jgi:NAD(P)H-hydrate epimerase